MSANRDREEEIFDAARELAVNERAAYLAERCGQDADLRQRIEGMLAADAAAGEFFKTHDAPSSTVIVTVASPSPSIEKPGDRIGRYKLLQQIGEGGCGVVYMAEQEEPVRRRVALKVIKIGMDTKQVIARFEAERQALALMDHPNIAKIHDAGITEGRARHSVRAGVESSESGAQGTDAPYLSPGRPYFVMELVRGIKITDFCDENKLSTADRLKLFIQVCQAIQHAHQKGVIHRDIKPSNILVTINDGVPVPKVIDFGIAKATAGRLTDQTLFTAFEQFIGTPAYMSPEQAVMTSLDIDTRSDIYSLGVLLYELLTGHTPFDAKELMAAGLDAMRRTIREEEPPKPSTRLGTMAADALTTTAKQHHTDAPKLVHALRGDLDWIAMKCLEKDRARRYETANGLVSDIQRHLSNEPVVACPPSNVYRFQKLVRRNKLAFAAASAVTAALVIGLGVSTVMFFKVQGEKKKAQTEAAKATAISDFLQQMLSSANPDALKGSEYTVRQLLDDFSAGLTNQFEGQPEVEAAVRATIGTAYHRLGIADKASAHLERTLTLRRRIFGEQAEQVAETLKDCAWSSFEQGQHAQAELYAREALEIYRKRGISGQPVISVLFPLQRTLIMEKRFAEADAVAEEAFAIARKSTGIEFPELASMIHGLADVRNNQSRYAEAESLARNALEMHRRLHGAEHPETAWALFTLGVALRHQQKLSEAEAVLRESVRIFSKYYSLGYKTVDIPVNELKGVLEAKGDTTALKALESERRARLIERNDSNPERVLREALALQRALLGSEHPQIAKSLHSLSLLLREQGRLPEAESTAREALVMRKKLLGNEHADVAQSLHLLAWNLNLEGKHTEAEALSRDEVAMWRKLLGNDDPNVAWALGDLTVFLRDQGKLPEAETAIRESLAIRQKRLGNAHPDTVNSFNLLVELLRTQGKEAEANALEIEAAREHVRSLRARLPADDPQLDSPLVVLTQRLIDKKKFAEAEVVARESLALREKIMPDKWFIFNTRSVLGEILLERKKYAEAEPLLLSGYEGLKQREENLPAAGKVCLRNALERLVQLYEATSRSELAAEWKAKLAQAKALLEGQTNTPAEKKSAPR